MNAKLCRSIGREAEVARRGRARALAVAVLVGVLIGTGREAGAQLPDYTIEKVVKPNGIGAVYTIALGINESGQVAGYTLTQWSNSYPTIWQTPATPVTLPASTGNAYNARLEDINEGGQATGQSNATSANYGLAAARWTGGIPLDLGILGTYGMRSHGWGINDSGHVAGYNEGDPGWWPWQGPTHAFRWAPATGMVDLGTLPAPYDQTSAAFAINNAGKVVGRSTGGGGTRACLWSGGTVQDLGVLNPNGWSKSSRAVDINDNDQVAGSSTIDTQAGTRSTAFRWSAGGGMVALATAPLYNDFDYPEAINNDGVVVGWVSISPIHGGDDPRAVAWDPVEGVVDLTQRIHQNPAYQGWTLFNAYDINDEGQIVGYGIAPDGEGCGFVMTPIEP